MKPTLDRTPTADAFIRAKLLHCSFLMLGHKRFVLLDHEDAKALRKWAWHWNRRGYAARLQYVKGQRSDDIIYLHRVIKGDVDGIEYDHENRNKLDCQRHNLRIATQHQNAGNIAKRKNCSATSKFKGVCFDTGKQRWLAQGRAKGKMVFLGRFKEEIKAAIAYNAWASKHFGEFAFLNPV